MSKKCRRSYLLAFIVTVLIPSFPSGLFAQGTAFTYQGYLQENGVPANGPHDFRFQLLVIRAGGQNALGAEFQTVPVTNGLFQARLTFSRSLFDGNPLELQISVRPAGSTNAYQRLLPDQSITATPYAVLSRNISQPLNPASLSGNFPGEITLSNPANVYSGSGANLENLNADAISAGTVDDARLGANVALLNQNLVFQESISAKALITGFSQTLLDFTSSIAGGRNNYISPPFSFVGGGDYNRINAGSEWSTIAGGATNIILNSSEYSTISGGRYNTIDHDNFASTIGGGGDNRIALDAIFATISGGRDHFIGNEADYGTIGGGVLNIINTNAQFSTISGGFENLIEVRANYGAIGGGLENIIGDHSTHSTIGGGVQNSISNSTLAATIGGGWLQHIGTDADYAVIGGGRLNMVSDDSTHGVVGGGLNNIITDSADFAVIVGGRENVVSGSYSLAAGRNAVADHPGSFVWADSVSTPFSSTTDNQFRAHASGGVDFVTSGSGMTLDSEQVLTFKRSTILGGTANRNDGSRSVVGGGEDNTIEANVDLSTLTGGLDNTIHDAADYATISGGRGGTVSTNADYAVIVGGLNNTVEQGAWRGSILGGRNNRIGEGSDYATVVGGLSNEARGNYSLAAGRAADALHTGTFVWADSSSARVLSSRTDEFTVKARGGVRFFTNDGLTTGATLAPGGGSWSSVSDRNQKENLETVDTTEILNKVSRLPIRKWNYKSQEDTIRHIGPMAQDFAEAFEVGENKTTITSVDADGVALAAIQGLVVKMHEELQARDERIRMLEQRLERLEGLE